MRGLIVLPGHPPLPGAAEDNKRQHIMQENPDRILKIACALCGMKDHATFAQTIAGEQLRWYVSIACPSSPHVEEDGLGGGPEELRNALLHANGIWSIHIDSGEKLRALQIMRRRFSITGEASSMVLRSFPIFDVGTEMEAVWLAETLTRQGISAEVSSVRFSLERLADAEVPDLRSARDLLATNTIDLACIESVSHHWDGSMSIILNRNGDLSHLGIEFSPARTRAIDAAFSALGIPVQRMRYEGADEMLFSTSPAPAIDH